MSDVDLGATPHGRVAFDFARALIAGDFDSSYGMLSPAFQDEYSQAQLREDYSSLFSYAGETEVTSLAIHEMGKINREDLSEIGWACAGLAGPVDDEGVWLEDIVVRVVDVAGRPLIRDIVWGRP